MMMKCARLDKDQKKINYNIIKGVINLFRLRKEIDETATKDIRNLVRLKKENDSIKGRVIRDIRRLFEHEKEKYYYKPVRVGNFWSNNYIKYESNSDRNTTLSIEKHLNIIRPYLKQLSSKDSCIALKIDNI